jgi:translocation and assembly module TamA
MKRAIFLLLLFSWGRAAHAAEQITELCNIRLKSTDKISFSSTEKKWLCGDPSSDAWKVIPKNQQRHWLQSFLQSKGYLNPTFHDENGILQVETGTRGEVKNFSVKGAPLGWDWERRRGVLGSVLDPSRLNSDISWAKHSLESMGYPCPEVDAYAYYDRGALLLEADPGPKQRFGSIESSGKTDLDPKILERFNAFYENDFFDVRLLELTSYRVLREDLYFSTFYDVICDQNRHPRIVRRYVPAPPRLITFGIGFDTENGPLLRGRWKVTRLTKKADSIQTSAFLSFRDLQAEVKYRNHFPSDLSSHWEFDPRILVDRRDEQELQSIEYLGQLALATSWELRGSNVALSFGPEISRTRTLLSLLPVPSRVDALRLRADITWLSHYFEYYSNYESDPREGYNFNISYWTEAGRWLTDKTIHKLFVRHEMLWNLGNYDPPWIVLGWRGFAGVYFFNPRQALISEIPPSERFFLGGDDDIRGYGRQKLRGQGLGYLTSIYDGIELRILGWLPYKFQPFFFFDAARMGIDTETLDSPFYWSPGVGLRWSSPVGTLRFSLARGFASEVLAGDPVPDLQFFLSFGKEF